MKKTIKKLIIFIQILTIILTCSTGIALSSTQKTLASINNENLKELSYGNRLIIAESLQKCIDNGKISAQNINKLKGNKENFEIGVREVLDKYYSADASQRTELSAFANEIDDSAKEILANYAEAEFERNNQANLDFETEKVVVAFPNGTTAEQIENSIKEHTTNFKIIDNGNANIDENLPDYKKERLEAIRDWKSDVIVLADTTLEDTVEKAIEKIEESPLVKSASRNNFFEADGTITTSSGSVYSEDNSFEPDRQWSAQYIDIPKAWNRFNTVNDLYDITIAVIDCGVQMGHIELEGPLVENKSVDVTRNNKLLTTCDDSQRYYNGKGQYTSRHGTMVSGIMVAQANNTRGLAGIASIASVPQFANKIKLMAIKCDNTYDSDRHITKAYLASAINYAVDNGADVINISYSAPASDYSNTEYSAVQNAVARAIAAEVVLVCSAGNDADDEGKDGTEVRYPAGFSGVIGVGATYKNGNLAVYSNRSTAVDIVAPGGYPNENGARIMSTSPTHINVSGFTTGSGTSYAAPHVAATVAMMRSINYDLTPGQFLYRLRARGNESTKHDFIELDAGQSVDLMDEK